jgi:hypothetical protein
MLLFEHKSEKINMSESTTELAPDTDETTKAISRFSPEAQAALRVAQVRTEQFGQTYDKKDLEGMRAALREAIDETEPKENIDKVRNDLAAQAIEKDK